MVSDYFDQVYDGFMQDWLEDPVYVKGYYISKSYITGLISQCRKVNETIFIHPITFKEIHIARKFSTNAEFYGKLVKAKDLMRSLNLHFLKRILFVKTTMAQNERI